MQALRRATEAREQGQGASAHLFCCACRQRTALLGNEWRCQQGQPDSRVQRALRVHVPIQRAQQVEQQLRPAPAPVVPAHLAGLQWGVRVVR